MVPLYNNDTLCLFSDCITKRCQTWARRRPRTPRGPSIGRCPVSSLSSTDPWASSRCQSSRGFLAFAGPRAAGRVCSLGLDGKVSLTSALVSAWVRLIWILRKKKRNFREKEFKFSGQKKSLPKDQIVVKTNMWNFWTSNLYQNNGRSFCWRNIV